MKKLLIAIAMLSAMLLGVGTAFAATAQLDNLPGGAGVILLQANKDGNITLFNVQNIEEQILTLHFIVYDQDSNKKIDFPVTLSGYDDFNAYVFQASPSIMSIQPTNCNPTTAPNVQYNGILGHGAVGPQCTRIDIPLAAATDGWQRAYMTFIITGIDTTTTGGAIPFSTTLNQLGAGGGVNAAITFGTTEPDSLYSRVAYVLPGYKSAYAMNGWMVQGFANMPLVYGTGAANASFDTRRMAPNATGFMYASTTSAQILMNGDTFGTGIDSWELFLSTYYTDAVPAANTTHGPVMLADCYATASGFIPSVDVATNSCNFLAAPNNGHVGNTVYPAFGAAQLPLEANMNGFILPHHYNARWDNNPSVGSATTLVAVFPANSGPGNLMPARFGGMGINGRVYGEYEDWVSIVQTCKEICVMKIAPDTTGLPTASQSGELIFDGADVVTGNYGQMAGFSFIEAKELADTYPIVSDGKFINPLNSYYDAAARLTLGGPISFPFWFNGVIPAGTLYHAPLGAAVASNATKVIEVGNQMNHH